MSVKTTGFPVPFKLFRETCGELWHRVKLVFFVASCRLCGDSLVFRQERGVCGNCVAQIPMQTEPLCPTCGRQLGDWYEACGECLIAPPPFRKHVSFSRYQGPLRELLLAYKYGGLETLKYPLSDFYIRLFHQRVAEPFDYVLAVPPDSSRDREFDHIHEIAKILAKQLNIPLLKNHLIKIKKTLPQAKLTRVQRLKNLNHAFLLRFPEHVKGKKILLLDDVYTTGTTMGKCAALLTENEADVVAMTLAHS